MSLYAWRVHARFLSLLVIAALTAVALLTGCTRSGQSDDEGSGGGSGAGRAFGVGGSSDSRGINLGPPSVYDSCTTDAECRVRLEAAAAAARRGLQLGPLIAAECQNPDPTCGAAPVCQCVYGSEPDLVDAFAIGGVNDCYYHSRTGGCLIPSAEFEPCDPDDLCSCAEQCAEALSVAREHEARVLDVEARHAQCTESRCRVVLRIEDRCFADFTASAEIPAFDCSLSDEAILRIALDTVRDGGLPGDCSQGCDFRSTQCGIGHYSQREFYSECSWSMTCGDDVCGTPVCTTDADSGVEECSYEPGH